MKLSQEILGRLLTSAFTFKETLKLRDGKVEEHWICRVPLKLVFENLNSPYSLLLIIWKGKKGYCYNYTVISERYKLITHSQVVQFLENYVKDFQILEARNYFLAIAIPENSDLLRLVIENSYTGKQAVKVHLYKSVISEGKRVLIPLWHNILRRTHNEWEEKKLPEREEFLILVEEIASRVEEILPLKVSLRRLNYLLGDIRTVYRIKKGENYEVRDFPIGKWITENIRRETGNFPTLETVLMKTSELLTKKHTGLTREVKRKVLGRLAYLIRLYVSSKEKVKVVIL